MSRPSPDRVLVLTAGGLLASFLIVHALTFRTISSSTIGPELLLETDAEADAFRGAFFAANPAGNQVDVHGSFRRELTELQFESTVFFAEHELEGYQARKSREDLFQRIAPPLAVRGRRRESGVLLEWDQNPVNEVIQRNVGADAQLKAGYRIYRWREGQQPARIAAASLDTTSYLDVDLGPRGGRVFYSVLSVLAGRIGIHDTLIESKQSEVLEIDLSESFELQLIDGTAERATIEVSVVIEANRYSARFEVASGDSIGTLSGVDGRDGVRTVDFGTGLIVKGIVEVSDVRDQVIQHPVFNPDGSRASDDTGFVSREEVRKIPIQRLEVRCENAAGQTRVLSIDRL